jgi:NADPH-ferrihemoprotein reductase
VRVVDLDDVTCETSLQKELMRKAYKDSAGKTRAVFLVATYGEGEAPDSAEPFLKIVKRKMGIPVFPDDAKTEPDPSFLKDLEYAVFGLGNRQYEHYNAMGKFFDASLHQIGAKRILDLGMGDDDEDLEGDFEQWKDNQLWPGLTKRYHVASSFVDEHTNGNGVETNVTNGVHPLPSCPYSIEFVQDLKGKQEKDIPLDDIAPERFNKSTKHYFTAVDCPVTLSRELRAPVDVGSTLHVEVDVSCKNEHVQYKTADNMAVLPLNDQMAVEKVSKALGYDLEDVFRLKPATEADAESFHHLFPTPCSVRECLTRYCDLVTPPRRSELKQLAQYAKNPLDRKALERIASKEGKVEYKDKIVDHHIGIADIVSKLCTSLEMPLEHFISTCARLQPRFYTISSSSSVHPDSVHMTVSIMKGHRKDGLGEWTGVCTNHLSNMSTNGMCRAFVRNSSFRLPVDVSTSCDRIYVADSVPIATTSYLTSQPWCAISNHSRRVPLL